MLEHTQPLEVPAHMLARWREQAQWIAKVEPLVMLEVADLAHDCTPHRLMRCAKAARYVAATAVEPYAGGAKSLAAEFEEMGR